MRVLHVVDSDRRRGAELFAAGLVSELGRRGVEQHVVLLAGKTGDGIDFEAPTSVPKGGGPRLPFVKLDLRLLRGLSRVVRDTEPDIVQAHGADTLKYTAAATIGRRALLVQRAIGFPPPWISRGPRRLAYALIFSRSTRIIAVAESVRSQIIRLFGLPPERVLMIPTARDAGRITSSADRRTIRERLRIPLDAPVVISLGALTWEKDPLTHLEVMARLLQRHPECRHLVVGDGPLREAVDARVRELGIEGRVHVLGSRDDVGDLLAASDVMLHASRMEGMEGMPGALIEAGFAGIPAVAYSVAGVEEVITNGETGCLVSAGDLSGLVDAIQLLVNDRKQRQAMGEAARKRTLEHFDIAVIAPEYFRLYEELVSHELSAPSPGPAVRRKVRK